MCLDLYQAHSKTVVCSHHYHGVRQIILWMIYDKVSVFKYLEGKHLQ